MSQSEIPKLSEKTIFGQKCYMSGSKVIETTKGEKGVGRFVSDYPSGKRGEWIAYTLQGESLEGEVVKWS